MCKEGKRIRKTMLGIGMAMLLFTGSFRMIPAVEEEHVSETGGAIENVMEDDPANETGLSSETFGVTEQMQREEPAWDDIGTERRDMETEDVVFNTNPEEPGATSAQDAVETDRGETDPGDGETETAEDETDGAGDVGENEAESDVEEEDLEETVMSGEEVAEAIHEIIEASSQMLLADMDGIERLQDYIEETQAAYGMLTSEEQEALAGSFENLGHASVAVDVMQESMVQLEETGTIILEQSRKENSWRFIDGVPVRDALQTVAAETVEVAEVCPEETLLSAKEMVKKETPKGELLSRPVPAEGQRPRAILVDNDAMKKGIDVSEWQGAIDWARVKEAGIQYAIIRCGYGNDFLSQDDDMWLYNVEACEQYGIPYGVYLYSKATTDAMIDSEVAHTLRLLEGHNPQLPVYLDVEENSQFLLGDAKLSKLVDRYCSKIMAAGYKTGIYCSTYYWTNYLSLVAKNDSYFHWVAQWNAERCTYGGRYEMWQYGIAKDVPGVQGDVDVDIWYGALPEPMAKAPMPKPVADSAPHIEYSSHVQSFGWEGSRIKDGGLSGTEGQSKRLEGIQIEITNDSDLGVEYRTHVQTYGWESGWRSDGETSGTVGQSKRLEAIQIRLTGKDAQKYDVYYCVHAQHFGWLNWAKNGESAGTAGYSYRLEGIRVQLVKKGDAAPVAIGNNMTSFLQPLIRYNTHVQTYGWQGWSYDGNLAGTTGQSKRLEGIHIQFAGQPYSGDIEYRTHIQTYGWESGWKKNGAMSGTTGQSKRLEAIQIRLTGEMAQKYDVYYQTHIQRFGWSGWAKNGEACGSAGYAYRLEGIRIVLVGKDGSAPGSTANRFHQR